MNRILDLTLTAARTTDVVQPGGLSYEERGLFKRNKMLSHYILPYQGSQPACGLAGIIGGFNKTS